MIFEDIWDNIVDGFSYVFSFEWIGDIGDFFSGMFDNLGEFSVAGLLFSVLTTGFIYAFRKQMLNPFLVHMGAGEALFWGIATYLGGLIGGYLVGKALFDRA